MQKFYYPEEQYVLWFKVILTFMGGCGIIILLILGLIAILALGLSFSKVITFCRRKYILVNNDGEDDYRIIYHKKN